MPTIVLLAIGYQIQNKKWRYILLALAALNLIFNVCHPGGWVQEFYSAVILTLLFMLNPYFFNWWQKRNDRNNPTSFWQFTKDAFLIAKHNKFKIFFWLLFLVVSVTAVCLYTGYTQYVLLGWLMAVFLIIYVLRNLFRLMLPPEWFLHDLNTGYVFLSVLIASWAAKLVYQKLGVNFVSPMLFAVIFGAIGFHYIRQNTRYLISGSALILSDIAWQIVRFVQSNAEYVPAVLITAVVLIVVMLIGLIWLVKKPGIMPIAYLVLFQLFRFSGFAQQAIDQVTANGLSVADVTNYTLYLVCWMYIVPLMFWFVGLRQQVSVPAAAESRSARSNKKFFESFKKE